MIDSIVQAALGLPFALLVGGSSHVFADMLPAPDTSSRIDPVWRFDGTPWGTDPVRHNARRSRLGFFRVNQAVCLAVAYLTIPEDLQDRVLRVLPERGMALWTGLAYPGRGVPAGHLAPRTVEHHQRTDHS